MKSNQLTYHWKFQVKSSPQYLWPLISNTNLLFNYLKLSKVKKTAISRFEKKGFLQLLSNNFKLYNVWEEEPYHWEKPYRFGTTRYYKVGLISSLRFLIDLDENSGGTKVHVHLWVSPGKYIVKGFLSFFFSQVLRLRFKKVLKLFDECGQKNFLPYQIKKGAKFVPARRKKIKKISEKLLADTQNERIVGLLTELIEKGSDQELQSIQPYELAEKWAENKYNLISVFFHAANQELLDFGWDISCPNCKTHKHHVRKMNELQGNFYCDYCEEQFGIDFNGNVHLVFKPHPLVRKLSDRKYCHGGPQIKPHIAIQQHLNPGDKKYLKVQLEPGTWFVKLAGRNGKLTVNVAEDGDDDISLIFNNGQLTGQQITMSTSPNLIVHNRSSEAILCQFEKKKWNEKGLYASEISSFHEFRSLFSSEILREGEKLKAKNLTILFTDLLDSTSIYLNQGEDEAIGQVMNHFKIIQKIVSEERGSVVKTIGDSVMAVFHEPVSSLKAVERIQKIFSNSNSFGDSFKLKAGIHVGDCTAVTLNNRIDFFGTAVNIASRLVDVANEKEIIISEQVYNHADVRRYLTNHSDRFLLKDSQTLLKGFSDEEFMVKQIRMDRPKLRLVI